MIYKFYKYTLIIGLYILEVVPITQIAVVTGASRGLGRAVALGLAEHGFAVAAVARNLPDLERLANESTTRGGRVLAASADVTDPQQIESLGVLVERRLGTPTILINAAGIFGPLGLIASSDPRLWLETLQTNTIAPYLTCRAFIGGMLKYGWGRIINFSSAASLAAPGPLNSAYVVSKVALNQLTRQLAVELEGTGVTANVIHPGEVKTDMWSTLRDAAIEYGTNATLFSTNAGSFRTKAASFSSAAQGIREWAQWVEATGGDPPHKTVDLILKLLDRDNTTNGQFLWIEDGLQRPLPSW